ncbi:cell wall-binding repeat-containing protein [Ornithinimicrobium pekingense]|uniref:Calx-beta domain-containing protein n=1 Tax=Ornithinimicrobium pekingense TaxID=384677 RepID=A0ABQ2F7N8_9MICO|nr:cell wall-binding repeat-containing protein [Ornithinimicrobium pekingense]GGK70049.1 hypothetical protein GCM10011509_18090 [Ornithinimicrobium pekingense]
MSLPLRGRHRDVAALVSVGLLVLAPLAGAQAAGPDDPQAAQAAAPGLAPADLPDWVTITNGTVTLGVWNTGELNVPAGATDSGGSTDVGLRFVPTGNEATSIGCLCEGWGAADATSGVSGFTDRELGGPANLRVESFTATADSAVSTVVIDDGAGADVLRVQHDYHPSSTPNLYEVRVTLTNLSGAPVDPRYRRVTDWGAQPTAGAEWMTIEGADATAHVRFASNDGFAATDPLAGPSDLGLVGDFEDQGPMDHGSLFDLGFDPIAAGGTLSFTTYYGAAATEAAADTAVAAVNAAAHAYAQPSTSTGPSAGSPNTFVYAVGRVGAAPAPPTVSLTAATSSVAESAGSATVGVQLSAAATVPVTVDYATSAGTATAGADYTQTSGTLTFAPGTTAQSITVPIIDDTVVEGPETVQVTLSNATGGVLGTPSTATLTITDDDVAPPPAEVERWSGIDRYGTAAAVAEQWGTGVPLVYVASGRTYPDALSAGALAGMLDAPMLLVRPDGIPNVTADALDRLAPQRIVVLGGPNAVSTAVEDALAAHATAGTADEVTRLAGIDRYGTAAAVAGEFGTDVPVVYVATGRDYPDALSGAARAGLEGGPVLLTRPDGLPASTRAALTAAAPSRIVVLGGSGVVDDAVLTALEGYTDGEVVRRGGTDRYDTAALGSADHPAPVPVVFIATGQAFPDALTSGPAAVRAPGPVLLTRSDQLPQRTRAELERLNPARIVVLGGPGAVSAEVEVALAPYIG